MTQPPPIAMLAELTHRCPLACPYCSNPLDLARKDQELTADQWADVFAQAAALGVLQLHLSGGEPAARSDLTTIMAAAHGAGLYTNLITSGIGLTPRRLDDLVAAGMDHLQLSLQGATPETADRIGGYAGGFARKMQVAEWVADRAIPLTINAVLHRQNIDEAAQCFEIAERFGARRIEIACVQFHGWAAENRAALMPTRAQHDRVRDLVAAKRVALRGRMVVDFVPPDYYSDFPKACMGGWGKVGLNVTPDGRVLPCHAAESIPGMSFARVTDMPLTEIWADSAAFNAYRGTDWLPEPCQSCDRREIDFGGCRCQAMALAGRADATDPICGKSPDHAVVAAITAAANGANVLPPLVMRQPA